ncbi:hypothetical protein LTR53_008258 [Teratosphaeriaceae sp. CCFEE 6253]|nr:hypothetical protein LTR53_008258 [Teratosphaeriaceae sp. CCFEE 6253]
MAAPATHTYAFTLPSIADDTTLDCRLYYPTNFGQRLRRRHGDVRGAVFAHPYAPLGGSYDDPVVMTVVEALVAEGWVVGTFNFRGAGGSQGSTSWTGRGEIEDFASVAGFMVCHLQHLRHGAVDDRHVLSPIVSADPRNVMNGTATSGERPIDLLLGGYSYGALVLNRLPFILGMLRRFQGASTGSAAAEIVLRAHTLAEQTLEQHAEAPSHEKSGLTMEPEESASLSPTKRTHASPITVGGEETESSERRRSRDSRRSVDLIRKSVDVPRRIKAQMRGASGSSSKDYHQEVTEAKSTETHGHSDDEVAPAVRVVYLIVSPLILPFTTAMCPPGSPSLAPSPWRKREPTDTSAGAQFLQHPTLAVFGDKDGFTSSKRLRAWAEKQAQLSGGGFKWTQVQGAAHFWREEGAMRELTEVVAKWA